MKNTLGLNIGVYISSYRGGVHLGGESFFNFLIRGLNDQICNTRSKVFLICDDINDLKDYDIKNLSIIQVSEFYRSFKAYNLAATNIAKVVFKILRFLRDKLFTWNNTNASSYHVSRESIFENLIDENHIDLMIYANQFSLPTINRPYIWVKDRGI